MFVCSRSEALRVLKIKGDLSCCYAGGEWPRRCDCKYGGPEESGGSEKTGCPELATLYRLIEAMDDATWDMMLSKAGHTLLHARAASQAEPPAQTRVEVLATCLGFFASVIKSGEPWTETCERNYQAAKAQLDALNNGGWRDIATAPKDGTWILLAFGGTSKLEIAQFRAKVEAAGWTIENCWIVAPNNILLDAPTHWQPRPLPPTPSGESK